MEIWTKQNFNNYPVIQTLYPRHQTRPALERPYPVLYGGHQNLLQNIKTKKIYFSGQMSKSK